MRTLQHLFFSLCLFVASAHSQQHRVEGERGGYDAFLWKQREIATLTQLPIDIRAIVNRVFSERVADFFVGKVKFREGVHQDVRKYLSHNNKVLGEITQPTRRWVVPAYDLWFTYSDSSVGVKSYSVHLLLDEYGQILSLNLPHQDQYRSRTYSDSLAKDGRHLKVWHAPEHSYSLSPLDLAVDSATLWAKTSHFHTDSSDFGLRYDECSDSLFWTVSFFQTSSRTESSLSETWQTYEIEVQDLRLKRSFEEDRGWIE